MEAVINHRVSVGLLHLPLSGFYFHLHNVAPEGVCRLFLAIGRGEEGSQHLLKMQNHCGSSPRLPEHAVAVPRQVGQNQSAVEAVILMEKNLTTTWWACTPRFCPGKPTPLWLTESSFSQEQVKRIETMYDHMTNLRRMTGPQVRLGQHLIERLTLKLD